jgi:hypothetical protein
MAIDSQPERQNQMRVWLSYDHAMKSTARNHVNLLINAPRLEKPVWWRGLATTFIEHDEGFHPRGRDAEPL